MHEFVVGEHTYRSSPMNAMTQFHVTRRLAPSLAQFTDALPSLATLKPSEAPDGDQTVATRLSSIGKLGQILGDILGSLSDEDAEFIISACLATCQRQAGNSWSPVWNLSAKALQHADINLAQMLSITANVLRDQLTGFFRDALSAFRIE